MFVPVSAHLVHDPALFQTLHQYPGGTGIVSLRLLPQSASQAMCQLRNDWLVVLDLFKGVAVKLFTRKIGTSTMRGCVCDQTASSHLSQSFPSRTWTAK